VVALLAEIPTGSTPPDVAPLRLYVPAGGGPRLSKRRVSAATYHRRRVAAAGLLLLVALGILVAVQAALGSTGGAPLSTSGAASGLRPAASESWVVQPGDTLWKIALSVQPHGDIRPLVDRLAAEVGGGALYPGEVIPIPQPAG
jgi:LysM domain